MLEVVHIACESLAMGTARKQRNRFGEARKTTLGVAALCKVTRLCLGLGVLLRRCSVFVAAATRTSQVRVINRRMERHRRGRASILIALLVQHFLKLVGAVANLVVDHLIVSRASRALNATRNKNFMVSARLLPLYIFQT